MIEVGATVKWQSSEYFASKLLPADNLAAYMGELAISRSAGTLHAEGGPCPIIAVFRPDIGLGALLHVNGGDAEIDGDNHEELIHHLLEMGGEIAEGAMCHVFLDELPMAGLQDDEDEEAQKEARKAYSGRIKDYLESKGMGNVTVVFDGEGKAVELDTVAGTVTSKDDEDEVAFSHTYQPAEEAAAPPAEPAPAEGPKADEEKPE